MKKIPKTFIYTETKGLIMAQGKFTKEEAIHVEACVKTIIDLLPKSKMMDVVGEMNDLYLFLSAAKAAAPAEVEKDG
jgi:hypothetical protein